MHASCERRLPSDASAGKSQPLMSYLPPVCRSASCALPVRALWVDSLRHAERRMAEPLRRRCSSSTTRRDLVSKFTVSRGKRQRGVNVHGQTANVAPTCLHRNKVGPAWAASLSPETSGRMYLESKQATGQTRSHRASRAVQKTVLEGLDPKTLMGARERMSGGDSLARTRREDLGIPLVSALPRSQAWGKSS